MEKYKPKDSPLPTDKFQSPTKKRNRRRRRNRHKIPKDLDGEQARKCHEFRGNFTPERRRVTMDILVKDIRPGMKNLSLTVIILEVGNATPIKEREVRTLKVADGSACINLSLWDEPGRYLIPGDIIRMTKAHANVFRNCLTLYTGKAGDLDKLGDFCMVFNEQLNMSEPNLTFEGGPPNLGQGMNNGGPAGMGPMGNNNCGKPGPRGPQGGKPPQTQRPPQEPQQQPVKNQTKINSKTSRGPMKVVRTDRR